MRQKKKKIMQFVCHRFADWNTKQRVDEQEIISSKCFVTKNFLLFVPIKTFYGRKHVFVSTI